MSTKKKGVLTTSLEWAKHLRPFGKRRFWKRERGAARKIKPRTVGGDKHETQYRS